MAVNIKVKNQNEIKECELIALEVEKESVIVKLNDWRMRVYFGENSDIVIPKIGQKFKVKYTGDIKDATSVKFQDLK